MNLGGTEIKKVVCDSRLADAGSVFVCLAGAVTDGHKYVLPAYDNGCRVFVCQRNIELPSDAVIVTVPDTRIKLAELSAEINGRPADRLKIIGITGTKGKTTVSFLLYEALKRGGKKTALIGTNGIYIGEKHTPSVNSTPESCELHRVFAEAADSGAEYIIMEVSSQAYKLNRVFGLQFEIGVFTNLSHDHISASEHRDYDEYRACKAALFAHSKQSILNADDCECLFMSRHAAGPVSFYSAGRLCGLYLKEFPDGKNVLTAGDIRRENNKGIPGVGFTCNQRRYSLKIPGKFNVSNAAAVIAVCDKLGIGADIVKKSLAETTIKGRFEPVEVLSDRVFIIDYAHNGASLSEALETLREYHPLRLVCLFGSVGGRTELRRAEMGAAAGKLADFLIITSDNPDRENPLNIIEEIQRNVGNTPHICIADRREAVEYAVRTSIPGDIILFAGKGHENYQLINGNRAPFCERDIIMEAAGKYLL